MLFWSIGKFKVVELGYMTPRGSLGNLGPKQKGKESWSWGHPCGLQGFVLFGCAVWTQGFTHSRPAAQPPSLFLSAFRTDTAQKRGTAMWGFPVPKVVAPFHVLLTGAWLSPHRILTFPPRALCNLWIRTGNSCCSVMLLLISAAEAKLQPAERESARDWSCLLSSFHVAMEQGNPKGCSCGRRWGTWSVSCSCWCH